MKSAWTFSLGGPKNNPIATPRDFARVELLDWLNAPHGNEAWLSGIHWSGNYREKVGFLSADAVALDFDWAEYDVDLYGVVTKRKKPPIPAQQQALAMSLIEAGKTCGTIGYTTPHGVRLIALFDERVGASDYLGIARALANHALTTFLEGGVSAALEIDESSVIDLARMMFAPNISCGEKARTSRVVEADRASCFSDLLEAGRMIQAGIEEAAAAAAAARAERAAKAALKHQAACSEAKRRNEPLPLTFAQASDLYAEHHGEEAASWPARHKRGECPMCGSPDGFSLLSDGARPKWACRSTRHERHHGGTAASGAGMGFWGGIADVVAARVGVTVKGLLVSEGLLRGSGN